MGTGTWRRTAAFVGVLLALAVTPAALAAFPGTNPSESSRANTPNDPEFDPCEADDPDTSPPRCSTYFEEQFGSFGFSPDSANEVPAAPHEVGATRYVDCSQLDAQGRAANAASGDPRCAQIAGVRADTAWKYSPGDPRVVIAILDTGIRWQDRELVDKVSLNRGELPLPRRANGSQCRGYDCNGDGAFNVQDYAPDSRVAEAAGDSESDSMLDASDLIARFSDGVDRDSNGYVDDIAGWDFFDDDNDPFDASSCCSAGGHGTGRAREALAETDNGLADTGMCPGCQLMPLRIWDTFVPPTDNWAMALTYAVDNRAAVAEGAIGGLTNTQFARDAVRYADRRGMSMMLVSSDINSANHNYPTNYNEAVYVAGALPDTAPNETCSGPGGLPGVGDVFDPGPEFEEGCQELLGLLAEAPLNLNPTTQPITTSFFRNSNLTQYGGKADIVLMGSTGSQNTGQAAGAAGLLESFARERFRGTPFPAGLSGNETRQLLTMTAEDVLPANTGAIGLADKANPGWDPHFGYGRVNLAAAMRRIATGSIPPEAQIHAPAWFAPIDLDRVPASGVPVTGHVAAPHSARGVGAWRLEYACGQDARDSQFALLPGASGTGPADGRLGTIPRSLLAGLAANCDGSVRNDPGRPAGTASQAWPHDPYPNPDPERHAFQIRLVVSEAGRPQNVGQYRKTLFAYDDDGSLAGWPRPIGSGSAAGSYVTGSGGETATRLYDVDGDNELDVIMGTSSGEVHVLHADGASVARFNHGDPVRTGAIAIARSHGTPPSLPTPREPLRVPAIGDVDGDDEADIVATAGERAYAWHLNGAPVEGFPVRVVPRLSNPCVAGAPRPCFDSADRAITTDNHIKRGFLGSAALADLDDDGRLDVVAGALDQHLYAWDGDGDPLPGFPAKLSTAGADGAEIVTTPAIAQLDGQGPPEVIVATNEVVPGDPQPPGTIFDVLNAIVGSSTGSNPVYAVHGDGSPVSGWPIMVGVLAGDLLPMVLPGNDAAVLDADGDDADDVVVSAATSITGQGPRIVHGDGSTLNTLQPAAANSPDQGPVINLADYPAVGDLAGSDDPAVVKGGLTLNGVANLLAVNQNLPFSHVEQAWNASSGAALPRYPRATDDFQLLSQAAIARVAGGGPSRQALVGTGLYQLHAYGPNGGEPAGWPKFTGGWIQSTPAVGDADGNGRLDVSIVTREGWSFLWRTGVPACDDSNEEWWTFHHDEHNTANYATDARPPGSPTNLRATRAPRTGLVTLTWRQPGDDWMCGRPARYRVIASANPIWRPTDGRIVAGGDPTGPAGSVVRRTVARNMIGGARHVAVLYRDEVGNWGLMRRAAVTLAAPNRREAGEAPGQ